MTVRNWFYENWDEIQNEILREIDKIDRKPFFKRDVNYDRIVKLIAWENYIEIRSQTQGDVSSETWDNREAVFEYDFGRLSERDSDEMYDCLQEMGEEFQEDGFFYEMKWREPLVPMLVLIWE